MRFLVLALLALLPVTASGQVVALDLEPGTHYLKITVDSSGKATATRIPIVAVDGAPVPPRDDEPKPPIPDDGTLEEVVFRHARAVGDPEVAGELSSAFSAIAIKINDDTIKPAEVPAVMQMLVDKVLGSDTRWDAMRSAISAKLTAMKIDTKEELSAATEEIAAGLLRASKTGKIDIAAIIELIKMILEIIKTLRST